jgi:cell division protein ZapA
MIEKSPSSGSAQKPSSTTTSSKGEVRSVDVRAPETRAGQTHVVTIAGVPLRLKSSHDAKTVNELVAGVDQKVREALPLTRTGSIQNAAILAALHLAEENLTLRQRAKAMLEKLEVKTQKVISELENSRMTGFQSVPRERLEEEKEPSASSSEDGASPAEISDEPRTTFDN